MKPQIIDKKEQEAKEAKKQKRRDTQYFIPGWNIGYALYQNKKFWRQHEQMMSDHELERQQGQRMLDQAKKYAELREEAKQQGRHKLAKYCDVRIARLAFKAIDRIKYV